MFCDQCGQKNSDVARFCFHCGNSLMRELPIGGTVETYRRSRCRFPMRCQLRR